MNDFIDSSDPEFPLGLIDKEIYNISKSKSSSTDLSNEDCLDKNVLVSDRSSRLALKTRDFQLHQHRDVALFVPKSRKAKYKKGQKRRKSGWKNKINPVV